VPDVDTGARDRLGQRDHRLDPGGEHERTGWYASPLVLNVAVTEVAPFGMSPAVRRPVWSRTRDCCCISA